MILLDTHVWWWSLTEPENLTENAKVMIREAKTNDRYIASISIWEFAMMVAKKRIALKISPSQWLSRAIDGAGITVIDLSPDIAIDSCDLPGTFHKDPADRLIVSTARIHSLTLVTKDQKILDYPYVNSTW
ncbi:VapC2: tRNA(fMet)-specific endonuclease [Desulfosarcina variabilis str. Montpellier]|uniref:type II toxin-antitoxin system VapC family toxin n=1 Tax=Desulfosarcina variabilis TaxID=2300 RepID=UPI003AFA3A66